MVNIPTRYDLPTTSQLNHEIKNFNDNFCKRIQLFQHVHLTEMTTDRKHFTKHGLHLNKIGKEGLAREIALHMTEIIKLTLNNNKPMLPLPWDEVPIIKNAVVDLLSTYDCNSTMDNASIFPPLNCNSTVDNASILKKCNLEFESPRRPTIQQELTKIDQGHRISERQNKASISRNSDFLW